MWGPFQLIQKVGAGSFGEVYRAFDTTLEREVALKLLLPGALDRDSEAKALLREARAIARVRHPNVVRCTEWTLTTAASASGAIS